MDLKGKLASFSKETKRLEAAYIRLQKQFYELKGKLANSHQTLEQIFTHMTEGLIFVTKGGQITLFNPAAAEMLGVEHQKILHTPFEEQFEDGLFGFSMKQALKLSNTHQRTLITLNGEIDLEVSTASVPYQGILLLLTNRTEQQKLQKSLHQAERLKEIGEMAATLAHEIRNPLGGIEGFAQLLKQDLKDSSHEAMLHPILEGIRVLNHLVNEVLDYARPLHLHFAPADLVGLVKETLSFANASFPHLRCAFTSALRDHVLSLDREKIQRVILNILRNAAEAEATQVQISLTQKGAVHFRDNGKGISQKTLEKIFTPFFTTKSEGSGVGLAHSMAIIKAHDGALKISSQEGEGTEIEIQL